MVKVAVPSSRAGSREDLHERARRWSDARVTFERIVDVTSHCPRCEALLVRRMGPGVVCSTCGRLWLVRELLEREATLTSREEQ
jgi:ribosomal protein L37AE/L43A